MIVTYVTKVVDYMKIGECRLFQNTNINTSGFQVKQYPAGYIVELEGSKSTYLGIVLQGSLTVTSYTLSGNPIQISTLQEGMIFGDVLLFANKTNTIPGNIITQVPSSIAMIPYDLVETYLISNHQFLKNFLGLLTDKVHEYNMNSKLLSQDTLRDKILFFLRSETLKQQSSVIEMNMTKEELANKLHVQRPSLSRELIHMRKDGLIDFDRWTITLK